MKRDADGEYGKRLDAFPAPRLALAPARRVARGVAQCPPAPFELGRADTMTRSILAILAAAIAVAVLSGTGCNTTGIGDPCIPEQEYSPDFQGFDPEEVSVESKSFQCLTRLCLVNHFRGRVSCPYGQKSDGSPVNGAKNCCPLNSTTCATPAPGSGCCTPGIARPVTAPVDATTGKPLDTQNKEAQCPSRTADKAVYCSCRCANLNGATNDGANYCTCPDGFRCQQLVTSIGQGNEGLTGAYCVKTGTEYDPNTPCGAAATCNAALANCGSSPTQQVVGH
jgi:hypothetical protein